ncbi:MAG TPA: trehalose-6-phosphate synthase [Acetobacteraceae bacterium]|nr:trehalose-6-phosphate synthase [Acetobacteraceae bacterium]
MPRLVIVSNRVPLPTDRGPRAGGLAVALADALRPGSLWFGWSGKRGSRTGTEPVLQEAAGITYATIDLSESDYRQFYAGYSNGVLWPLLHYRLGLVDYSTGEYTGYRAVNRRFAACIAPLLQPDDLVWVHDYHLIPLGEELRRLGVRNRIGFFLHTPFVPPELIRALPHAEEMLAAFCAYDVAGFHTSGHCAAFLRCMDEVLGVTPDDQGHIVTETGSLHPIIDPIGIDAQGFATMAANSARGAEAKRMKASLANRVLAIGVDRLDYSKGLVHRFEAFARLLAHYPQHRRQVSLFQVAPRSREDLGAYQTLRQELDRIVGDTNGQYSEFDWVPLRYMTRAVGRRTLSGFYRIARLGVVTPLRDGMNLVAKEFVAAQPADDPGVLVLSQFAGAADEMTDALVVNPFDADAIAEAMHVALTMGADERKARYQALRARVWDSTAAKYCETFLSHLQPPVRGITVLDPVSAGGAPLIVEAAAPAS